MNNFLKKSVLVLVFLFLLPAQIIMAQENEVIKKIKLIVIISKIKIKCNLIIRITIYRNYNAK